MEGKKVYGKCVLIIPDIYVVSFLPTQNQMIDDEIGRLSKERQQLASQLKEVGIHFQGSSWLNLS